MVEVRRIDGQEEWVLLHIEVQSSPDKELEQRLYQYHHRLVDRYGRRCATLVILADEDEKWHPVRYEEELWGCRVVFEFLTCKLLELEKKVDLERSKNVAAVVIGAHLAAQRGRGDEEKRLESKWRLTRRLYELGLGKKEVLELFRLIDWLIVLSEEKEVEMRRKIREYEEKEAMPHITAIERLSRQEGNLEARQRDILETLELRFERVPEGLREAVEEICDADHLAQLFRKAVLCSDLEDFTNAL